MKSRKAILLVIIVTVLALTSCSSGNSVSVSGISGTEKSTDIQESLPPETADTSNTHPENALDSIARELGDAPWQSHYISLGEEPDSYNVYMEGMGSSNAGVRWYCAYNIFKYDTGNRKKEITAQLDILKNDPVEQVRNAAGFSTEIMDRTFNSEVFCKSPDGKYIVFCRYNELTYKDMEVYVFDIDKDNWYVLDKMDGGSFGFKWSPDSKKIALIYGGRTWINCTVMYLDTKEKKSPEVFGYIEKNKERLGFKSVKLFGYQSIRVIEWNPASNKLLLAYGFTNEDDYTDYSGTAIYDLEKDFILKVTRDSEGACYPEPKAPEGFKW